MNDIAAEYYNISLFEYENGTSLPELRKAIDYYEKTEEYEVCQGISLAVGVISFSILTKLVKETNNKIKLKWK